LVTSAPLCPPASEGSTCSWHQLSCGKRAPGLRLRSQSPWQTPRRSERRRHAAKWWLRAKHRTQRECCCATDAPRFKQRAANDESARRRWQHWPKVRTQHALHINWRSQSHLPECCAKWPRRQTRSASGGECSRPRDCCCPMWRRHSRCFLDESSARRYRHSTVSCIPRWLSCRLCLHDAARPGRHGEGRLAGYT
jgi:hypothetical protein